MTKRQLVKWLEAKQSDAKAEVKIHEERKNGS